MSYGVSKSTKGYGRNAGHRWRADDLAELRRLVRRGTGLKEISLKLGRPVNAIRSKASSIGLHLDKDPAHALRVAVRNGVRKRDRTSGLERSQPATFQHSEARQLELF